LKLDIQQEELRFQVREGAEYFTTPAGAAQRRYEALRAYFTEAMPASEVADRFGYSTASVHQMATLLRTGKLNLFAEARPGPKGPRKATGELRAKVLALRAAGHSITEIAAALTAEGLPISAQTCWQILDAEGMPRLPRRDEGRRGPPARLEAVKAAKLPGWPQHPVSLPCDHAGLLLLFPAICDVGLPALVRSAGYPSARVLSSWQSAGSLLLAKCARKARIHHAGALADDQGLAFTLGLTALPKATHLGTYSWRVRRDSNQELLTGLIQALRPLGLATGKAGFDCDFHAIRHHGTETVLEKHYVPRRSQRTRAVLTFFAQDHASADMVYANADITKAEQAAEIIAFADYWNNATGSDPGLLVFDSQLTTYKILDELTGRGINWLTLRQRGKAELARLAALPASAWKAVTISRSGRYRRPRLRGHGQTERRQLQGPPDRGQEHRPRRAHPADHPRPSHPGQGPVRPLRRADDGGKRAGRLHRRVPPRRPHQRRPAQRGPGHHADRHRREPLPAARAQAPPLRECHPRPDLAGLPGCHRHSAHHRRRRHLRTEPAQPPPRPHRRRLRRPPSPHPLVGRAHATIPVPAAVITRPQRTSI
jgi:transposase